MSETPSHRRVASTLRLLGRGLVRRCARCGARRLFIGWFKMVDRCPGCGYVFAREEGFFLGAFVVNFAVTTAGLGVVMGALIMVLATGGNSRSVALVALGGVVEAVLVPIVFYPFSKTVWTAIDLAMHRGESWAAAGAAGRPGPARPAGDPTTPG